MNGLTVRVCPLYHSSYVSSSPPPLLLSSSPPLSQGNFKEKFGIKRERAPFVFTIHMAAVLGGVDADAYKAFVDLCCRSYNVLRRPANASLLMTLMSLMLSCGIPELQTPKDIRWLLDKVMLGKTEHEASSAFKGLIKEALKCKTTRFNDAFHLIKHV